MTRGVCRGGRARGAVVAVIAVVATLLGGCTNTKESIRMADEYAAWLRTQPQVASVERSEKRNSGIPPMFGSVRLEADATAKEPFGDKEMTALGHAIERYGKEKGHFTSWRTTMAAPGLTIDLDEKPADNAMVIGLARETAALPVTERTISNDRGSMMATMTVRDPDAAIRAYSRLAPRLVDLGSGPRAATVAISSSTESRVRLSISASTDTPVPTAVLDTARKAAGMPAVEAVSIEGRGPRITVRTTQGAVLPTRRALLTADSAYSLEVQDLSLTVSGNGDLSAQIAAYQAAVKVAAPTRASIGPAYGQGAPTPAVDALVLTMPTGDDVRAVVEKVPMTGVPWVTITSESGGSGSVSLSGSPADVRGHLALVMAVAAAATEPVSYGPDRRAGTAAAPQQVVSVRMLSGASNARYIEVLDAARSARWTGDQVLVLEGGYQRPSFRFTSTATGRARDVGPAYGTDRSAKMSADTKALIAHWDAGATTS